MMLNIFSNFDPMWFNLCYKASAPLIILLITMSSTYWSSSNKLTMMMMPMMSYILNQFMTNDTKTLKTMSLWLSSTFIFILTMNMTGMLPYMFSSTSHIMFTLCLALPLWLSLALSSTFFNIKQTAAHLLPDGGPLWLNPFLVLIESASIMMRPLTLSFRLAANMTAGHVMLNLILLPMYSTTMKNMLMVSNMSIMYITFELMICVIQAYVFCLLISLYSNDHARNK